MTTTRRRTLLPWMGGKSKLASHIIARLPDHDTYVEPFCGGCAVFFSKPRSKGEVLNDADSRLVNLLRVFRYHPDELQREVWHLTHSREEFRDALAQPGVTDIQRAARFLLVVKACFGGRTTSPSFGYGLACRANFSLSDTISLIESARDRLDGVIIENLDFAEVIARYDSPRTLFYCDPPYIGTAGYACKFTMDDHTRLRDALAAAKGRAVVSLNDHPDGRQLYAGWKINPVFTKYTIAKDGTAQPAKEVLISNKL